MNGEKRFSLPVTKFLKDLYQTSTEMLGFPMSVIHLVNKFAHGSVCPEPFCPPMVVLNLFDGILFCPCFFISPTGS